jgi:branched-chain amino acid transport system permease protein
MELAGLASYLVFFFTMVAIYAILSLGLNIQWGFTGQINIGVAAFFAVGAYTSAILTAEPSPYFLGGFSIPFLPGVLIAMLVSGLLGLFVGLITLNLRGDYLAIASIGIAETVRLVLKNEAWLTNGVRGIPSIPKPLSQFSPEASDFWFMALTVLFALVVYLVSQRLFLSPWVRVLRAIRSNEDAVKAAGKNVLRFRVEAFVLGCMIMGVAGSLYAHFTTFISPSAFEPMYGTFLVWVMLIAGGSGNNRGAILGALVIWALWSGTEIITIRFPDDWVTRMSAVRIFLIGALLEVILIMRPQGLLPEKPPENRVVKK